MGVGMYNYLTKMSHFYCYFVDKEWLFELSFSEPLEMYIRIFIFVSLALTILLKWWSVSKSFMDKFGKVNNAIYY